MRRISTSMKTSVSAPLMTGDLTLVIIFVDESLQVRKCRSKGCSTVVGTVSSESLWLATTSTDDLRFGGTTPILIGEAMEEPREGETDDSK